MSGGVIDPVERFLGADASSGGPFALLGIRPDEANRDTILRAVDARMRQLDAHPARSTPDADEVRLALHSAAANLLDPEIRRELLGLPTQPRGQPTGQRPVHLPPPVPVGGLGPAPASPMGGTGTRPNAGSAARSEQARRVRREIAAAVALSGGWNTRAQRRLMLLGRKYGISVRALAIAARASGTAGFGDPRPAPDLPDERVRRTAGVGPTGPVSVAPRLSRQAGPDAADRIVRWILVVAGIGFVAGCLAVITLGIRSLESPGGRQATAPPPPAPIERPEPSSGVPEVRPQAPRNVDAASRDLENPAAVLRELQDAAADLSDQPGEAVARFARAVDAIGRHWPEYPPDRLTAAQDALLEFMYRAGAEAPEAARAATEAIARPAAGLASGTADDPDRVWPAAWSAGTLLRLRLERDLPAAVGRTIDRSLSGLLAGVATEGMSFERGAVAALRRTALDLVTEEPQDEDRWHAAWAQWSAAADALGRVDPAIDAALDTYALETLVRDGPSPRTAPRVVRAITDLGGSMPWRADDGSRRWLVNLLADLTAPVEGLATLTSAVATRSGAEGIDPSMTLSRRASDLDRRELAQKYADVWSLAASAGATRGVQEVHDAAIARLDQPAPAAPGDDLSAIADAAIFSRLNASAALAWRGDEQTALDLLDALDTPVRAVLDTTGSTVTASASDAAFDPGGSWGESYLLARASIPRRIELLESLSSGRRLGVVDADVLVREALLGTPRKVRDEAMELVLGAYASQPVVINGLLELLPRAPRTQRTSELIADIALVNLPDPSDPAWPVTARRALVERLLELLSSAGPLGTVENLVRLLADAYDEGLGGASGTGPVLSLPGLARLTAERHAGQIARGLPAPDPRFGLAGIEARRTARLGMADGVVQMFAAEQAALCETLATLVAAERPAVASRVAGVLDDLAKRRRDAGHVLEQIASTERAITRLWLLRFGVLP